MRPTPDPHEHSPDDWDAKLDDLAEARDQLVKAALSGTIDEIEDEEDLWEMLLYDDTMTVEVDAALFIHLISMTEQHLQQPMDSIMALMTVETLLTLADQGDETLREHIEDYYGSDQVADRDRGIY